MRTRSANEWRDFWLNRGERELASMLGEYEPHLTRIATLLGSSASCEALGAELARIREHELALPRDSARDTELAARVYAWFEAA